MFNYILVTSIIVLDLTLGLIVYFRDSKNNTNLAFFVLTFLAMIWIASNFLENEVLLENYSSLLLKIDFASAIILAYFFLFFCLNFPKSLNLSLVKKIGLVLLPLVFSILSFSSLIIKDFSFYDGAIQFERGIFYWFYALTLIAYIGLGSLNLLFKLKKSEGIEKIRIVYILIGLILSATVAILVNLILTQILTISIEVYRIGIYGISFFIIFTTYALIKHHLMNIKVIATELLVGVLTLVIFIDLILSESFSIALLKTAILIIFVYLGISLIKSVLKEIEYRERVKKAYEIEKKAHKELKRLDEAKNQFLMATQHHLRTPLTSMQGYLDLMFGGTYGRVPVKLKKTLHKLQVSTDRLVKVVNELLDLSQFQLGKRVISPKPNIRIEPLLKEIVEELKFEAENKHLYLTFEKSKKAPPAANIDPGKIKVALYNIVDNGIKYTYKGGVTIKARSSDHKLLIEISDTGIGFIAEELKGLFSRTFERGEEAKKVFSTGKGIGLYIAHKIIDAHKGKVWVESKGKGKGSTFFVELPIKP